jgi:hypothetical protein
MAWRQKSRLGAQVRHHNNHKIQWQASSRAFLKRDSCHKTLRTFRMEERGRKDRNLKRWTKANHRAPLWSSNRKTRRIKHCSWTPQRRNHRETQRRTTWTPLTSNSWIPLTCDSWENNQQDRATNHPQSSIGCDTWERQRNHRWKERRVCSWVSKRYEDSWIPWKTNCGLIRN